MKETDKIEITLIEHNKKMREMPDSHKRYYRLLEEEANEELLKNADLIASFKVMMSKRGIELSDYNFKYIQTIGLVVCYPNIVKYLCIDCAIDKEGLWNFSHLKEMYTTRDFSDGYLHTDSHVLMAHPFFRRKFGINNGFAPRFIEFFWKEQNSNIDSFIALDRDRVCVKNNRYMELDTYYGPRFNKEISQIPDGISHLRPNINIDDSLISTSFPGIYSFDVKWSTKNGIKTFQSEEFQDENFRIKRDEIEYYPTRYVHAEYDLKKNIFRHFDGAIHYYISDEYFERRGSGFNYNSKSNFKIKPKSEKLFKMNGIIDVNTWVKYTNHFMAGNPLVYEYFEGNYSE